MKRKSRKPRRIVLGVGHPWYSATKGNGYTILQLTKTPVHAEEELVEFNPKNISIWNKVRLVLEVIK